MCIFITAAVSCRRYWTRGSLNSSFFALQIQYSLMLVRCRKGLKPKPQVSMSLNFQVFAVEFQIWICTLHLLQMRYKERQFLGTCLRIQDLRK